MKKGLLLIAVAALLGGDAISQLSTRTNSAVNPQLGTRAVAGDAAFSFAIPIVNLTENNGSDAGLYAFNSLSPGSMLTFKYWHKDDLVIRAAFRFAADNSLTKGTAADSSETNNIPDTDVSENTKRSIMREYVLAGGVEKHFSNSNIWDVYVGAEGLIGLGKDKTIDKEDYFNGDLSYMTRTTGTTIFGFAGVFGLSAYVAELPLAIGLEWQWGGKWIFGGDTKVEFESEAGGTAVSAEWFEQDVDGLGAPDIGRQYSDLSRRQFNMETNNVVQITILFLFSTMKKG